MHMNGFLAWAGTAKAVPAHTAMMANGHAGFLSNAAWRSGRAHLPAQRAAATASRTQLGKKAAKEKQVWMRR